VRAIIKAFQLIKEERRVFLERFYFKLKEKHPEDISEFDSDKEIEVGKANIINTIFNKDLEFAEHLHEI